MVYDSVMVMMYGMFMFAFFIDILIAAYMYTDAEKRGKDGIVWGLIGFFFGITALIVWLIIRPPEYDFRMQRPYYPPPYGPPYQQQYQQPPQYPPQQPQYPPNPPQEYHFPQYGRRMYPDVPGQNNGNNPQYPQNNVSYDPYREPPKEE